MCGHTVVAALPVHLGKVQDVESEQHYNPFQLEALFTQWGSMCYNFRNPLMGTSTP